LKYIIAFILPILTPPLTVEKAKDKIRHIIRHITFNFEKFYDDKKVIKRYIVGLKNWSE